MKEKDYIAIANLIRLRAALDLMRHVVPDHVVGDEGGEMRDTMYGWIMTYEALVNQIITAVDED